MKTQFITLLTLLTVSIIFAQDSEISKDSKSFDFGVRLGGLSRTLSNESFTFTDNDIYLAVFATKKLSEKFSLQIEANADLSATLLFKYKIINKFEVYLGPQLEYNKTYESPTLSRATQEFTTSLNLGAQYNINKHWFIEARYNYGLSDKHLITAHDGVPSYGKKSSFNFGFGYKF